MSEDAPVVASVGEPNTEVDESTHELVERVGARIRRRAKPAPSKANQASLAEINRQATANVRLDLAAKAALERTRMSAEVLDAAKQAEAIIDAAKNEAAELVAAAKADVVEQEQALTSRKDELTAFAAEMDAAEQDLQRRQEKLATLAKDVEAEEARLKEVATLKQQLGQLQLQNKSLTEKLAAATQE